MTDPLVRLWRDHTALAVLYTFEDGETREALDRAIKRIEHDIEAAKAERGEPPLFKPAPPCLRCMNQPGRRNWCGACGGSGRRE